MTQSTDYKGIKWHLNSTVMVPYLFPEVECPGYVMVGQVLLFALGVEACHHFLQLCVVNQELWLLLLHTHTLQGLGWGWERGWGRSRQGWGL